MIVAFQPARVCRPSEPQGPRGRLCCPGVQSSDRLPATIAAPSRARAAGKPGTAAPNPSSSSVGVWSSVTMSTSVSRASQMPYHRSQRHVVSLECQFHNRPRWRRRIRLHRHLSLRWYMPSPSVSSHSFCRRGTHRHCRCSVTIIIVVGIVTVQLHRGQRSPWRRMGMRLARRQPRRCRCRYRYCLGPSPSASPHSASKSKASLSWSIHRHQCPNQGLANTVPSKSSDSVGSSRKASSTSSTRSSSSSSCTSPTPSPSESTTRCYHRGSCRHRPTRRRRRRRVDVVAESIAVGIHCL